MEAFGYLSVDILLRGFKVREIVDALELEDFFYALVSVIQKSIDSSEYPTLVYASEFLLFPQILMVLVCAIL